MDDIINGLAEVSVWLENFGKKEYHETVEKACDELAKHRWIPVSERLPDEYTNVLVMSKRFEKPQIDQMWIICGEKTWTLDNVTHWMPLPQPPKEGEQDG